jgi:hypothetical protein
VVRTGTIQSLYNRLGIFSHCCALFTAMRGVS